MPKEPSIRRRRAGLLLRQYREAAGLTCDQVGDALDVSGTKISRIETCKLPAVRRDVRDMLDLYQATDTQRAEIMVLLHQSSQRGWWDTYEDRLPPEYTTFIMLETEAASLRTFEPQVIPGLLQTEEYAREAITATLRDAPAEVEAQARVRMERQRLLDREPEPLQITAVVDEAALRRMVGSRTVMQEQRRHLIDAARRRNVRLQVLPFHSGAVAFTSGPMVIASFADQTVPDVVYLENTTGDLYLEEPEEIARYSRLFDELAADALGPEQSKRYIEQINAE